MRRYTDHRIEEPGFNDAIQGIVKNSPWWLISLVAHLVVLFILANIPYEIVAIDRGANMQASLPEDEDVIDEDEDEEPIPEEPEDIIDTPVDIEAVDERNEDDADTDFEDTANDEGRSDSPFTGPSDNAAIGLGPGVGGGNRGPGGRKRLRISGGSNQTQNAVELGLKWLADHQDVKSDGKWDCDDFAKHDRPDDKCDGPGQALYDVGVTGLATLAFLGAGYTDRGTAKQNRYAKNVRAALRYLRNQQDEDGCFGTRSSTHFMYNHAIATLAMCEAFWMTRNPRYKKPAQKALDFVSMSRNPYLAWRYEPRGGENDSSVTGWMVMALKSGKYAGLEIDPDSFEGARIWIDKMTDPEFGQCGYNVAGGSPARPEGLQDRFPPEKSQSMTAAGILTRIFLGEDPKTSKMIKLGAKLCTDLPPKWDPDDGSIDMYYWYYATLALFQVGGKEWKTWNQHMKEAIVKNQHQEGSGARTGSWDPLGPWGHDGGRVYSTATLVMCLEVYYRYDRVFGLR